MRDAPFAKTVLNRAPEPEVGRADVRRPTDHDSEYLALRHEHAALLSGLNNHDARTKTRA